MGSPSSSREASGKVAFAPSSLLHAASGSHMLQSGLPWPAPALCPEELLVAGGGSALATTAVPTAGSKGSSGCALVTWGSDNAASQGSRCKPQPRAAAALRSSAPARPRVTPALLPNTCTCPKDNLNDTNEIKYNFIFGSLRQPIHP